MHSIFRSKSVNRISTHEQLNQFVEVSGTFTWGILIALLIFLFGVILWLFTGHIDTKSEVGAVVSEGRLTGFIREEKLGSLAAGDPIYIEDREYVISQVSPLPQRLPEDTEEYVMYIGNLESGVWGYEFEADCGLEDGIYRAEVVTESIRPITFVLN